MHYSRSPSSRMRKVWIVCFVLGFFLWYSSLQQVTEMQSEVLAHEGVAHIEDSPSVEVVEDAPPPESPLSVVASDTLNICANPPKLPSSTNPHIQLRRSMQKLSLEVQCNANPPLSFVRSGHPHFWSG